MKKLIIFVAQLININYDREFAQFTLLITISNYIMCLIPKESAIFYETNPQILNQVTEYLLRDEEEETDVESSETNM